MKLKKKHEVEAGEMGELAALAPHLTNEEVRAIATARATKGGRARAVKAAEEKAVEKYTAPKPTWINVTIDWRRSATGERNPSADVTWVTGDEEAPHFHSMGRAPGRVSGGGYDKHGVALGNALNKIISPLLWDKRDEWNSRDLPTAFGGPSKYPPSINGGYGVTAVAEVMKWLGFGVAHLECKDWDTWVFTKG